MRIRDNLIGCQFGKLTVIAHVKGAMWLCKCSCTDETVIEVRYGRLTRGEKRTCGCHYHHQTKTPEYDAWKSMKDRCYNQNNSYYHRYGNRGIKVCDRWLESFQNFYEDMGDRPEGCSLDRKNNDGNYELDNCRWATPIEQSNNKAQNRIFTINGKSKTLSEWIKEYGFKRGVIESRVSRGWEIEKALNTPSGQYKKKPK